MPDNQDRKILADRIGKQKRGGPGFVQKRIKLQAQFVGIPP